MQRIVRLFCPFFFFTFFLCSTVFAQFQFGNSAAQSQYGPRRGEKIEQVWRAGLTVLPGAQLENVSAMLPIPMDWPEQEVRGIDEEKLDAALTGSILYENVDAGAREMILRLGRIRPHRKVEVVVNVRLVNYELLPPSNPYDYALPNRIPDALEQYVEESPYIECEERVFKKMFNEITQNKEGAWEKVEALYAFVQNNVKYDEAQKFRGTPKGALAVTRMPEGEWSGDCKDMSCLFVALCRAGKIPARIVRVPEHCYAEFYLDLKPELAKIIMDENRQAKKSGSKDKPKPTGYWFPCQVSGSYSFGGIPERQPILQKGDSYPDRERGGKAKLLFLQVCFEVEKFGGPPPRPVWIQEVAE